jgi:ABC-2 type transport system ATP-binding protein
MIRTLAENGAAVLVTTHGLDEAEYCNRLGIMVSGEIRREGTASELMEAEHTDSLEEAFISLVRGDNSEQR